ncbi:uncharacterized protein LOC111821830 [Trichechus manatus latirostris]|uniref:Uncharacterized protein LOC111821830 n=1 Tax=Trichechus manatus latirostris TaxID=127582 RepID=A0A2Y9RJ40_TRIMA|nr:uncharacterized protein LOC111821830 [Trichechus manatus latirostris]XP_023593592.1 uncharacterized protein LOC111821830 [Trichechus manatus latirostris]
MSTLKCPGPSSPPASAQTTGGSRRPRRKCVHSEDSSQITPFPLATRFATRQGTVILPRGCLSYPVFTSTFASPRSSRAERLIRGAARGICLVPALQTGFEGSGRCRGPGKRTLKTCPSPQKQGRSVCAHSSPGATCPECRSTAVHSGFLSGRKTKQNNPRFHVGRESSPSPDAGRVLGSEATKEGARPGSRSGGTWGQRARRTCWPASAHSKGLSSQRNFLSSSPRATAPGKGEPPDSNNSAATTLVVRPLT